MQFNMKTSLERRGLLGIRAIVAAGVLCGASAFAKPRPPLPPMPEFAPLFWRAGFDEAYSYRATNAQVSVAGLGELVESWSGYALQRSGERLPPFSVPALNATRRTNIACESGAIRFWLKPYWSSASQPGGAGPGHYARLLEFVAVGGRQTVGVWSLLVTPDGTAIHLATEADSNPISLLKAEINWQANEWHLVTLNYGQKGTALFIDGELVAEGAATAEVPPKVGAVVVGSTLRGSDAAGGEFDEVCSFARPLMQRDVEFYFGWTSKQAALGPITAEEEKAQREAAARRRETQGELPGPALFFFPQGGGGPEGFMSELMISIPVFTNQGTNIFFTLTNTEPDAAYEILWSTNMPATKWTSVARGITNQVDFLVSAPPFPEGFYRARGPLYVFAPSGLTAVEDVLSPLTNIALTGFSGFNGTVGLSVTNGTLRFSVTNGLTFVNSTNGTASLVVTGAFTALQNAVNSLGYLSKTNFFGTDRLTMLLTNAGDGGGLSDRLEIPITVLPVNDPPVATQATYFVTSGVLVPASQGLLLHAMDPDGDTLTVVPFFGFGTHGTIFVSADGSFTYSSSSCFTVSDQFTFRVRDSQSTSAPVTLTVWAQPYSYPPSVSITIPTNGAVYVERSVVPLTADAQAGFCDFLSQVQFFTGTNLIGSTSGSSLNWSNAPPGTHNLTAVAAGSSGLSATSVVVTITVLADADWDGIPDGSDPFPNDFYNGVLPSLVIADGNFQAGSPGTALPTPLQVLVTTAGGPPLLNAPITFAPALGGGLVAVPPSGAWSASVLVRADATGRASALFQLPGTTSTFCSITATANTSAGNRQVSFVALSTNQVSSSTPAYLDVFTPLK